MKNNFYFKKSLGQNFLKDRNIIHKIVNFSNIDKNTLVIEIGSGGGALSCEIVPLSGYAILYEVDSRLEKNLKVLLSSCNNYKLIFKDFLKTDIYSDVGDLKYDKVYVVANLPYYITTPILLKFIESDFLPDKMIVMVQKEVAIRLSAKVGSRDYGYLTVFLNYFYDINKLFDVSRGCFVPEPNVDSSVVSLTLKENRLFVRDMDLFRKVVMDSFSMKRKTIRNNLKRYDLEIIEGVLKRYNFDLSVRAEQLKLEIFVDISNELVDAK